jgi:PTH2 family peptidyl-tRNA hydrolase
MKIKMKTKQVILIRSDLNMPVGKVAAQVAHGSLTAITNLMYSYTEGEDESPDSYAVFRELDCYSSDALHIWLTGEQKKVCLTVNSEEELLSLYNKALEAKLPCSYIVDNGHTVFNGIKTPTVVAIGPCSDDKIDAITKHLKLFKNS